MRRHYTKQIMTMNLPKSTIQPTGIIPRGNIRLRHNTISPTGPSLTSETILKIRIMATTASAELL